MGTPRHYCYRYLSWLMLSAVVGIAGCGDGDKDIINKLTVKKNGDGSGRVVSSPRGISCGNDCSYYYADDKRVTLTANAAEGSVFAGWDHDDCTGTGVCVVTLDESTRVTAKFDRSLAGVWEVKGNGFAVEVNAAGTAYDWYEFTPLSRLRVGQGTIADGNMYYRDNVAISFAEMLALSEEAAALPVADVTGPTTDPEVNFEIFWQTFEQYYAFFDLLEGTSWQALYDQYRPQIDQHTTADALWSVLAAMIAELNDGHTRLYDFAGERVAVSRDVATAPSRWMMENQEAYQGVIAAYLDSFDADTNVLGNGNVVIGTVDERIGYLNIFAYDGYADTPLAPFEFSLLYLLSAGRRDIEPYADMLDTVFSRFADMDALVIDLRFNIGGSGDLTKMLAGRLTEERFLALSHRVRDGGYDDYHAPVSHYIEPEAVAFLDKPVIVLTSSNTVSAGDWQTLILKSLPNVTVMGEKTFGIFSEGIPRQLPNGWQFTLSTQRIYSAEGEFFEQRGIAPDIAVTPDADLLESGRDNMLEAALQRLR
ncbi:S41 family peptidase [Exilibacterium tricleocarpae]|uniref:S41 family peptidase n=1 Tax=Exilibacterium tricleocarpae TaxID=2591008 RepID=A0A545TVU5_9GAMM|nr:S41 family peptidase [Exilibacterium tricleocarpae]TQV81336.1 S41 family peptidase [Exilibacterium tricleocarpae]